MKAFEQPRTSITLVPATSFKDKRYTFVTVDTNGNMVTPAAGADVAGVLQTPGIATEPCNVMTDGVSFIVLGGTVAAGDPISTDATGKAVKATMDTTTTTLAKTAVVGMALVGGSSGDIGCVLLK